MGLLIKILLVLNETSLQLPGGFKAKGLLSCFLLFVLFSLGWLRRDISKRTPKFLMTFVRDLRNKLFASSCLRGIKKND